MIIGISGRIGVGKDVTGRIIQYLTSEYKDKYEYSDWIDRVENYGSKTYSPWEIKKFAGKLKQIASLLTGFPVKMFEDQEFKKTLLGPEWGTVSVNPLNAIPVFEDVQFNELMSVRELLQKLGTDAVRDGLHKDAWVNALFADYTKRIIYYPLTEEQIEYNNKQTGPVPSVNEKLDYPNWIITDMRFPNEMEAVVKRGGITIRVVRNSDIKVQHSGKQDDFTIEKFDNTNPKHVQLLEGESLRLHPSETALDDAKFDYEIINDGTLEELVKKVRKILVKEKLI